MQGWETPARVVRLRTAMRVPIQHHGNYLLMRLLRRTSILMSKPFLKLVGQECQIYFSCQWRSNPDYAMNEACCVWYGSFLEESAKESMGIDYRTIQDIAVKGMQPPNFNDHALVYQLRYQDCRTRRCWYRRYCCGLVYSICMNYVIALKGRQFPWLE